jgi:uncharacterized LabA/DUF88 family protein
MLNLQLTLLPFALASVISGFGIYSQQPSMIAVGAGLAGGIGSARLAQSRRDRVEQASDESIDIKEVIEQLNEQIQAQKNALDLQTQNIKNLQEDNHTNREIVAAKDQAITDYQSRIEELTSLVAKSGKDEVTPTAAKMHLLVDGNALRFVEKQLGKEINYQALRAALTHGAEKVESRFYIGDAKSSKHKRLVKHLRELEFEVSLFPIINVGAGKITTKGDDVAMALDAVKNASPGDTVVLVLGGDGDFAPVIRTLKGMQVNVIVASYIKTTSWVLKKEAGKDLVDLKALICANESANESLLSKEPALV